METSFVSACFGGGYSTAVVKLGFDLQTLVVVRPNNVVYERQLSDVEELSLRNLTHDELIKLAEQREREEEEREVQSGLDDLETEEWTRKFLEEFPKIQIDGINLHNCNYGKTGRSKKNVKDISICESQNESQLLEEEKFLKLRILTLKSMRK